MTAVAAPAHPGRPWLRTSPIVDGWELASAPASGSDEPPSDVDWLPAAVPGTVAGAFRDAGLPIPADLDGRDWWYRTTIEVPPAEAGEALLLRVGGIATLGEVVLDGRVIAASESMFEPLAIDVTGLVGGSHELAIHVLALAPRLAEPRKPRARWRSALVEDGNLRWYRTSLLGRAPGFSPGPPIVGPWREVAIERRRGVVIEDLRVRAIMDGDAGRLTVAASTRTTDAPIDRVRVELDGPSGRHATDLPIEASAAAGSSTIRGELTIPDVARWWPHTHGVPALHDVRLVVGTRDGELTLDAGRVGFRTIAPGPASDHDVDRDGLAIHVNGQPVFVRGAVWTPVDPIGIAVTDGELRAALELARDAGLNMLRIPGTGTYETAAFHAACDELGILVWQDLAFANLDYPFADEAFDARARREATTVGEALAAHPSSVVVCGNSEVEQQVAMLGLDPALGRESFYREGLQAALMRATSDAIAIPSAPFGGDLPFRPDRGVANYYGVGGYRRPLSDARTAGVRFAAECLAFSNVPDHPAVALDDPGWKTGIPRDRGADWDFEDVRDHYLAQLYGVDPGELRRTDPSCYLALSQTVTGEVMAEVFGEWRRAASASNGGLVLWWRDVVPGAGWGLVDRAGQPKAAYHHLRRVLAPIAVWTTDEGLGGIAIHVANDRPDRLVARLRVGLYRDREVAVGTAEQLVELPGHGSLTLDLEAVLGHFVDASWAYRFGPPAQDTVVATLEAIDGDPDRPISQAFRFPLGWPSMVETADQLGLHLAVVDADAEHVTMRLDTRKLAYAVRIELPGFVAEDDAFSVEPGHARRITLRRDPIAGADQAQDRRIRLTAAGLVGALEIPVP
jgi:beta-mannosidase